MKHEVLIGQVDYSVLVKIRDSNGAAKTGLTEASIDIAYARVETDNDVTTADVTPAALSALTDAHSDWGFKEVSATDHPGVYRLDIADAVFASGAWSAVVSITGSGLDPADLEFVLVAFDPRDAVRLGLTALPNAAAEASGGLPTLSAAQASNGTIQANVHRWLTGTPNALSSGRVEVLVGAVTNGVIAAASFAANALDSVWSATTRLLTAGTNIVLAKGTGVTGFNDLSAAQVNAEADSAIETYHLDHLLATTYDPASKPGAADALLNELVEDDGGVARYTANALEEAPTGGSAPTVGEIADAVWDEATSGHTTSGTFGEQLKTDVDAILADTNELQTDWVNGGRLDNILDARASQTSVDDVPTNAELTAALGTADDAVLAAIAALNNLSAAQVLTQVNAALDTQLADSVPADGTRPTFRQAMYMDHLFLWERSVSGTTVTIKKVDGTTLATLTLDDATTPTSITRAT